MDEQAVLRAFNCQVRQSTRSDGTGASFTVDGQVLRRVAAAGEGGSGIFWSELTEADADQVIAAQVAFFAARGERFEWKLYSYDEPADLDRRLAAAGFVPDEAEALMIAAVADLPQTAELPAGVRLEQVTDAAGVERLITVHERVFGKDETQLRSSLLAQLATDPDITALVVAVAGDDPVCAARIEFVPGAQFAGLWGGGTLPQWRGRGIYRALVAWRAALAAARGYRYLQVDASPDSRPILERLGFSCLSMTTPYNWSPAG